MSLGRRSSGRCFIVAGVLLLALGLCAAVPHSSARSRVAGVAHTVQQQQTVEEPEWDFEEPTEFVDVSSSEVEPAPGKPRKLQSSPCVACRYVIQTISDQAIRLKLSREDLVVNTQSLCQQENLGMVLRVQCNAYDEVANFLSRGQFLAVGANYTEFNVKPHHFCTQVQLCGAVNLTAIAQTDLPNDAEQRQGAMVVRFRLNAPFSKYSRPSKKWTSFVQSFIGDVAQALSILPQRLELHMHPDDELAELVIKRSNGLGPIMGQPDETPDQLARRLRALVSRGSNALNVPQRLIDSVDTMFKLQIVPLVVYPTLVAKPLSPKNDTNSSEPSCPELLRAARTACGETFKCGNDCKSKFATYFGKCLSKTLGQEDHDRVYNQFRDFFFSCDNCDEERQNSVKHKCNMKALDRDYPVNCSLTCSRTFMPYYSDCLAYAAEEISDTDRVRLQGFYAQCSRCTKDREANVKAVCDTRVSANTPYPAVCTAACSSLFNSFYDQCLMGDHSGDHKAALEFRQNCQVAADGGIGVRVKLRTDISKIENTVEYKKLFISNLATLLRVPVDRMEITLITPLQAADPSVAAREGGAILIDFIFKNTDNYTEANPRTLVSNLRSLINSPASALYATPQLSSVDSSFGVKTLLAGTHDADSNRTPSPLEIAKAELRKAIEQQELADVINLLRSIVRLRELAAKGNLSQLYEYKAQKRETEYLAAIVRKESPNAIKSLGAMVEYAQSVAAGVPVAKQLTKLARAHYMADIARDATTEEKQREHAILRWRQAQEYGVSVPTLNTLESIAQYFKDLADKKPKETLDVDKARINLMKMLEKSADKANVTFAESVLEYMRAVERHSAPEVLKAREAKVEYQQAIAQRQPQWAVMEKLAVLNYQAAVEAKSDRDTLTQLAKRVVMMHDFAEFERKKIQKAEEARKAKEKAEAEYQAKVKLDQERTAMAQAFARRQKEEEAAEQKAKASQPKMLK